VNLRKYQTDPMAFVEDLRIRVDGALVRFGDVMADFQRRRLEDLLPAFQAVSEGRPPEFGEHWWGATKGASKDTDLAAALLWLVIFGRRTDLRIQIGAADADQAGESRWAAKSWLEWNPWLDELIDIQSDAIVNRHTGTRAEIIAADNAGSQGARPDVCLINELSCITKSEFASNLADNAVKVHGVLVVATNAGTVGSWQHQWREIARLSAHWRFHEYNQPAPWLSQRKLDEAARRNTHSRFMRLFWGVWATGGGDALDPDAIRACIVLRGPMPHAPPDSDWQTFGALDIGVKRDRSAFTAVAVNVITTEIRLAACKSWNPAEGPNGQVSIPEVETAVLEMYGRFRLQYVLFDPWQCLGTAQRLNAMGCHFVEFPFSPANLDAMARRLMGAFRNREIQLFDDSELIEGLGQLSLVERPNGAYKLTAAFTETAGHADKAISLAMALAHTDGSDGFIESCRYVLSCGDRLQGGLRVAARTGAWDENGLRGQPVNCREYLTDWNS
jgi:hypothetical protein